MQTTLAIKTTAVSLVTALTLGLVAPIVAIAAEGDGPNTDNSSNVSATEVKQALAYTPGVLSASDHSTTTSDTDSAIVAATAGATIDVPKDASDGVTLASSGGPQLDIQLPNADQAGNATEVAPGVVAYGGSNGSANAVQTDENGGVRMLTVIDNRNAPTKYDYKVTVPDGGRIELAEDGSALILDNASQPISMVGAPWARDANGKQIRTWFTTDGITLTQHVKHRVNGVAYPVTADPWFLAAFVAAAQVAAIACAGNAAQSLIWQGAQWAIRRGEWNWTQKAVQAGENCAQGAVFGWAGRFIPAAYKQYVFNSIRNLVVNHLLWLVKR